MKKLTSSNPALLGVMMLILAIVAWLRMSSAHLKFPQSPTVVGEIEGYWLVALIIFGMLGMALLLSGLFHWLEQKKKTRHA